MQGGTSAVVIVHLVCSQVGCGCVNRVHQLERSSVHHIFLRACGGWLSPSDIASAGQPVASVLG